MLRVECPNCETILDFDYNVKLGKVFNCPDCGTELVVINVDPIEVDYYYGENIEEDIKDNYDEYPELYEEEEYHYGYRNNLIDYDDFDE